MEIERSKKEMALKVATIAGTALVSAIVGYKWCKFKCTLGLGICCKIDPSLKDHIMNVLAEVKNGH